MTQDKQRLSDIGEDALIERLRAIAAPRGELPLGQGDDCAITETIPGKRLVWTLDTMVEGVHFRFWRGTTAADVGYKLGAMNLSDLASKGARPRVALVSLAVPRDAHIDTVAQVYEGLAEALGDTEPGLIGGDTVRADEWVLSLALVGEIDAGAPVAGRDRACPGDGLYVTGTIGDAAAGLAILENEDHGSAGEQQALVHRFLRPSPRIASGGELIGMGHRIAMMDLSDGLARDGVRMARASDVRLVIESEALPASPELAAWSAAQGRTAVEMALRGGEDYELLFACEWEPPPVVAGIPVTRIGRVEEGSGVWVSRSGSEPLPVEQSGFEHF